jgi:hypothetical protein
MGLPCQDIQARNFFKKVADYRKLWKLQEQDWLRDDESPGDHADDDCDYINDDNPDASPPDGSIPHLCSLGFLKVAQKWKALTPSWLSWELGGRDHDPCTKSGVGIRSCWHRRNEDPTQFDVHTFFFLHEHVTKSNF